MIESLLEASAPMALKSGTVASVQDDGALMVVLDGRSITCQRLVTSVLPAPIAAGDDVIVWQPMGRECVVLGRIGPSNATEGETVPNTLLLEASQSLTLRVGDGSITIRDDGKVLIKGKDLVSHAQRMNRIKGGSVSIN